MRGWIDLASLSCARFALFVGLLSALGCAGSSQPPRRDANPPPPDPSEMVRAREGGPGPVFQLENAMTPEQAAEAGIPPPSGDGADSDDEDRRSE